MSSPELTPFPPARPGPSHRGLAWLAAAVLGASVLLTSAARAEVRSGDVFPALAEAGLAGELPETAGKVVYVDFWASWCAPCKASFPALAKLHADFAPQGVVVLAVGVDDKEAPYRAWVKKFAPSFPTVHDAHHQLVSAVKVPTMPTSFVVGRDGRVRAVFTGYHGEETEKAVREALAAALAEPVSS